MMIGPADIQRWAESLYDDFLRSLLQDADFFSSPPRRDRLGRVPAGDDPNTFHAAVSPLWEGSRAKLGYGYIVVLAERQRRSRGLQNEPVAVEIPTRHDFLQLLDREVEVDAFETDSRFIIAHLPASVREILIRRPRLVVENHGDWPGIVEVVNYLCAHPRPACFVRALPVSVHTKFIERHKEPIEALLSVLPMSGYIADDDSFEARCGFLSDQDSIRGRFLCKDLQAACGFPENTSDIELRVTDWAMLNLPPGAVVIACENKANFLALPQLKGALALWGKGGAATGHFPRLPWLARKLFFYWGDVDPSGFAILARLRRVFPGIRSVLMDASTLARHSELLAPAKSAPAELAWEHLTPDETDAARLILVPPRGIEQEKLLFSEGLEMLLCQINKSS